MTIPEICNLLTSEIPNNYPILVRQLASLDTQTALDIIEKYNTDLKMSQKQLSDEIRRQTIKGANL